MDANGIIGREYEQKLILERCKSNKAELIAIYGRRRVGKTFLVRKMFNDQFAFSFIGMYEVSRAVQLEQFRMALAQYAKQTVPKLKTWFEAFAALREYLSGLSLQEPIVLFFDELPWMDTPKSNFIAAFSYFWNSWASMVPQLKLIVCGSSTTWMLAKFIGDKGGLYVALPGRFIWLHSLWRDRAILKRIERPCSYPPAGIGCVYDIGWYSLLS